jgi:hypothetical protein
VMRPPVLLERPFGFSAEIIRKTKKQTCCRRGRA